MTNGQFVNQLYCILKKLRVNKITKKRIVKKNNKAGYSLEIKL